MSQSTTAAHCINPNCPRPAAQPGDNKFCNSCGTSLLLNNRYLPIKPLGSGGFAVIYTVLDLRTKTEQVAKILIEITPKALDLFEQEAAVLANLRHPGIPRVESGSYFYINLTTPPRRVPCLIMEKINGETLYDILEHYPQGCPESLVKNWLNQALNILEVLHQRQIIHRDIKPSNLMLRQDTGLLVAIDFGGAKQITADAKHKTSSTRLFSPGYSPPEQMTGAAVGATADFYALGKTMIHLLTGKYPPDIEDPNTGELKWRDKTIVTPAFGDLLDDMIQSDVRRRPTNVAAIQRRLASNLSISSFKTALTNTSTSVSQVLGNGAKLSLKLLILTLTATTNIIFGCLDTFWEMIVAGIGASVGTTTGFWLAFWSPMGVQVADFLAHQIPIFAQAIAPNLLLFTGAGLGTAWGLTEARGFNQRHRPLISSIMGVIGYGMGGLIWQAAASYGDKDGLIVSIAIAVSLLTLGLGLPSHYFVHCLVTAVGTATIFSGLLTLNLLSVESLFNLFSFPVANGMDLAISITLFGFLALVIGFWLGISSYIIIPFLKFLGWR